jgi:hypothetical protein
LDLTPSLPAPHLEDFWSYTQKQQSHISKLKFALFNLDLQADLSHERSTNIEELREMVQY